MAKTRAQRKAEKRAREAENEPRPQQPVPREAPPSPVDRNNTQVPVSGDVAEVEAVEATGAPVAPPQAPAPPPAQEPAQQESAPEKSTRRQRTEEKRRLKAQEKEKERRSKERAKAPVASEERQRGVVFSFLASSWAELKRVQWPDRETLIQASAVTLVFVAVAAAYLGALDAAFSFLIKRII